jgi:hypothetical protein
MAIVALLSCTAPAPRESDAMQQLHTLSDPGFNGGLNQQEVALSQRLAQTIGAGLPEAGPPCCKPLDPPPENEDEVANQNIGVMTPALQELAETIQHGSMPQQAVALHAVTLMGKRAEGAHAAITGPSLSAWEAEALHSITCDNYGAELAQTIPAAKLPPGGTEAQCTAARGEWVLDTLADQSRYWPKDFLRDIWWDTQHSCEEIDGGQVEPLPVEITPERQTRLTTMLADEQADPEARTALIHVLSDIGPPAAGMAKTVLPMAYRQDGELSRAARQYIFSLGIPESVDMLHYGLDHGDLVYWERGKEIVRLRPYAHVAIPVFAQMLRNPRFSARTDAAESLGELDTPEAIPALVGAISSLDWPTTAAAIESLAPYAASHMEVRAALEQVSRSYWSGLIRDEAKQALQTGHAELGCAYRTNNGEPNDSQLGCIELMGAYTNDHKMPKCKDGKLHSGRYRTQAGKALPIEWREPVRQVPPRGTPQQISSWCQMVGTVEVLPVKGGWLSGCMGFESSGGLKFLPEDVGKKPVRIPVGAVSILTQTPGHIYAAGPGLFEMGAEAGGLDEMVEDGEGTWNAYPVAALPSSPTGVAVLGKSIAFKDTLNAVLYDPDEGISALACED